MRRVYMLAVLSLLFSSVTHGAFAGGEEPLPGEEAERQVIWTGPAVNTVYIKLNFAKILNLGQPAGVVVIGNTGIADASLADDRTVVLSGKAAGSTNMIVLDNAGIKVADVLIHVTSDNGQVTTVYRGLSKETYSCKPYCEPVLSVGDQNDYFQTTKSQIDARKDFATGDGGGGE